MSTRLSARTLRNGVAFSVLAASAIVSSPALAQPAPAAPATPVVEDALPGEIVVTAQRRVQRLQDVPISASVVAGESLARGNIQGLQDLSNRLGNVRISQAPAGDQLQVRGVGSGLNGGFEQSVATFVDGIYRSRARASRANLFDIERVEVLKGPQTTFFGNNAIAGALNITTRKPSRDLEANASALYGSHEQYDVQLGVGGPVTDTFRLRVAAGFSGMGGYIENERIGEKGPRNRDIFGRVSLAWSPTSNLDVTARIDRVHLRDDGVYNIEIDNCPAGPEFNPVRGSCARSIAIGGGTTDGSMNLRTNVSPSYLYYDYTEAMLNATLTMGDHQLTFLGGYFDHDYDFLIDNVPGTGASAIGTVSGLPILTIEHYRQFSQEVRFQSTGHGFIEYMVGAYASQGSLDLLSNFGYFFAPIGAAALGQVRPGDPPLVGVTPTSPISGRTVNHQTDRSMSVFASSTVNFSPALRLNLGLRYSIVDKRATREGAIGTGGPNPSDANFVPLPLATQLRLQGLTGLPLANYNQLSRSDKKLMPSVSLQYDVAANAMAYASFARGFKAGGYGTALSRDTFNPETVDAYEIGLKGSLLDRRVSYSLSAFYAKYGNLQEAISVIIGNAVLTTVANAAKSVSKGVEATISARITPELTFSTDLAYLSAKYTDYPNGTCTALANLRPPCTQDLSGKVRTFSPKFSGGATLSYAAPVGNDLMLRIEPSGYFSSKYSHSATVDPLLFQSAYVKVDARVSLGRSDGRWEVAVLGKNLTDRLTATYRGGLPGSPGSIIALPERPRSVAVQLSTKF